MKVRRVSYTVISTVWTKCEQQQGTAGRELEANTMATSKKPRPTDAELSILGVLWKLGASTVRQVHEAIPVAQRRGYTTTLKLMQIMAEKGLVDRDESSRSHVYTAETTRDRTESQLVSDLIRKAFDGSAARLAMRAMSERAATPDEIAQMRRMLDELEGGAA